jgi:hypothetical protein
MILVAAADPRRRRSHLRPPRTAQIPRRAPPSGEMPRDRDEPAAVRVYTVCDESK